MFTVLFIVGPPGSGKSEAYRIIRDYLSGLQIERINDYAMLKHMFEKDVLHEQFLPTKKYGGFTVKNFLVVNEALKDENKQIRDMAELYEKSPQLDDLLLVVEFSRNNYHLAFDQFDNEIVASALILLIKTKKKVSRRRLKQRVTVPPTEDNHYVPPKILRDYYDKSLPFTAYDLLADFGVPLEQVEEIDNNGTLEHFKERIHHFIDSKIRQRAHM